MSVAVANLATPTIRKDKMSNNKKTEWDSNTLIVTKRGSADFKVPFSVHKFPISSRRDAQEILAHPSIAAWPYGISVGYANLDESGNVISRYPAGAELPKCYYCDAEDFNDAELCSETYKGELNHAEQKWCEYCEERPVENQDGVNDHCAQCYREWQSEERGRNWDYYHA
jgi:hypothetical protein